MIPCTALADRIFGVQQMDQGAQHLAQPDFRVLFNERSLSSGCRRYGSEAVPCVVAVQETRSRKISSRRAASGSEGCLRHGDECTHGLDPLGGWAEILLAMLYPMNRRWLVISGIPRPPALPRASPERLPAAGAEVEVGATYSSGAHRKVTRRSGNLIFRLVGWSWLINAIKPSGSAMCDSSIP